MQRAALPAKAQIPVTTSYPKEKTAMEQDKQSSKQSPGSHQQQQAHPAEWATTALNQAEDSERAFKLRHSNHIQDNAHREAELVKQAEGGSQVDVQVTGDGMAVGNVKLQHVAGTKCELAHEHRTECGGGAE